MGKFDKEVAETRQLLQQAEAKYTESEAALVDAPPNVREFVLSTHLDKINEFKRIIELLGSESE